MQKGKPVLKTAGKMKKPRLTVKTDEGEDAVMVAKEQGARPELAGNFTLVHSPTSNRSTVKLAFNLEKHCEKLQETAEREEEAKATAVEVEAPQATRKADNLEVFILDQMMQDVPKQGDVVHSNLIRQFARTRMHRVQQSQSM